MARIRSVKPELFRHQGLFEAESDYQLPLRLAFMGLLTCCDREGRFRWSPQQLKLDIFPYDNIDVSTILEAFLARGFIKQYESQGKRYGYIPSWSRHQVIHPLERKSDIPEPTACTVETVNYLNSPGSSEGVESYLNKENSRIDPINCSKKRRMNDWLASFIPKNSNQIEWFIHLCENPPQLLGVVDKHIQCRLHALQYWLDK